jgi:hypothetical protein
MHKEQHESNLPLVSIITVSWNRKRDVSELVESLLRQTYKEKEIIVVDSASTDGTVDFLKTKYPSIRVIPLERNYGLHKGFNVGVAEAKGKIIVGIDHDCVLDDKEVIDKVVARFRENPKLGIVAFKVKSFFTKKDAWDNPPPHLIEGNPERGYPCLTYNGSGFAILREVYMKAGGLDEQFVIYYGEIDLTLRVLEIGYECKYLPDIIVFHKSSNPPTSNWYIKITQRNWAWFIWKNFPFQEIVRLRFLPFLFLLRINPTLFFSVLFETLSGFCQVLKKRKPLSYETINYYKVLRGY